MCEQKDFMKAQVHRIEIDKWCQGERQHSDPGEEYVMDWVYNNAKRFRNDWDGSACQTCSNHRQCGWKALYVCDLYDEMGGGDEQNIVS